VPVALVLEIGALEADALSDRLIELGAASVTVEDAAAGTAAERPIFDEPGHAGAAWSRLRLRLLADDERAARSLLERACRDVELDIPPALALEEVEDLDWVRATQAQFPPIRVSPRLWIVPSWQAPPDAGAVNVILDPGRAFGTGSHPTTRLCLEWLDARVLGGETVLDYGCGSGILAISAAMLGAGRVLGVDIDAQALRTASDNAKVNGARCEFLPADEPLAVQADLVVANILANPLVLLAPALARLTRPGGRIALSGILSEQFGEVAAVYGAWFDIDAPAELEGWTRVSGARRR
jgi:ribosomal protein L11 methyltransferase